MKKIKENRNREKKSVNLGLLITFILALAVVALGYVAMIKTEQNILTNYEKSAVCVVVSDIARHDKFTEDNINSYVVIKEIDKSIIPEGAITDLTELVGKSTRVELKVGTPITTTMLYEENELYASMEEPKELALSASDLIQGVSGIIRTGDYIDVYLLSKSQTTYSLSDEQMQTFNTNTGEPILKHVYVSGAFDAAGKIIPNSDKTTACQRFNIVLDKKDASAFYKGLLDGNIYIQKEISVED